jgi:Holliday junction resolvase RusA-like endonuclease
LYLDKQPRIERRKIEGRKVVLKLPSELMPPSANALTANIPNVGRVKTSAYRKWINSAGLLLTSQIKGYFAERVDILIEAEDKHPRRDSSNLTKPLEDLLVRCGVIQDDRSKFVRSTKSAWADVDGVVITIEVCA